MVVIYDLPGCVLEENQIFPRDSNTNTQPLQQDSPKSPFRLITDISPKKKPPKPECAPKHLTRSGSQSDFAKQHQTAIVLDWEDTLFPTTFVKTLPETPTAKMNQAEVNEMNTALGRIEECQAAAEALLRCAQKFGHPVIVTLAGRDRLKRQCEQWYPRLWKILNDSQINIVFALESHRESLSKKDQAKLDFSKFGEDQWTKLKGRAIAMELHRFYSQYKGQTWKNVISFGDSTFEIFGTMGAVNAYVQKNFVNKSTSESQAYDEVRKVFESHPLRRFDGDPAWSKGFKGVDVHENRIFNVRTKVVKLLAQPSPDRVVQQLFALARVLPSIVGSDGSLNLFLDDEEETTMDVESLESKVQMMLKAAGNEGYYEGLLPVCNAEPEGQRRSPSSVICAAPCRPKKSDGSL